MMKSLFIAAFLLGSSLGAVELTDDEKSELINHQFKHFSVRHTPSSKAESLISSRSKRSSRKSTNKLSADVEGFKVEWFQYISINDDSYSNNITQFGTWYKDEVTNDTRTEVVTYSLFNSGNGDRYYVTPAEYMDISGTEYQILEADSQYVYCQIDTPSPSENIEYEKLGYAFVVPDERAYSIVWGPRLVQVYYDSTTSADTVAYYGNDAYNGEPVIFAQYNTTYSQTFIWSKIRKEDVESTDFDIPSGLTCSSSNDDTNNIISWHDKAAISALKNAKWN